MTASVTPLPAVPPCCHAGELHTLETLVALFRELAEEGRILPPAPRPPLLRLVDDAMLAAQAAGVDAVLKASQP